MAKDETSIYLRDYKTKDGKSFGEAAHELESDELLKLLEQIHGNSRKAAKRRREIKAELDDLESHIKKGENKVLEEIHGKKEDGGPKSKSLVKEGTSEDKQASVAYKNALKILSAMTYQAVERDLGTSAAKAYKGNHARLAEYFQSKLGGQISFYRAAKALSSENIHDYTSGELYGQIKTGLAKGAHEESQLEKLLDTTLTEDPTHHDKVTKWGKKKVNGTKIDDMPVKISDGVTDAGTILLLGKQAHGKKLNADYLDGSTLVHQDYVK